MVKLLYHAISAFVGLCIAGVVVFLVFGNASEQGARPDGVAPESANAEASLLCGTIAPDKANLPATRRIALDNMPALSDPIGPIAALRQDRPKERSWVARVHAAGGLCIDEISFPERGSVIITMSTVDSVTVEQASSLAAGVIAQAFTQPFNPRTVTLVATVNGSTRRAVVGLRAWNVFQTRRRQLQVPLTMRSLSQFRAAVYKQGDLRISGWS